MISKTQLQNTLVKVRRHIHSNPELGNQEFSTTAYLAKIFKDFGIKTYRPSKTGLVAQINGTAKSSGKNKCLGIRADIDALPIQENTKKPYSSKKPGVMHACGHDANSAIALGAALLLNGRKSEFSGQAKFIFQPNEETAGGATGMIDSGVLKNPSVDAIIGIHVNPWLAAGTVGLKPGEMMASVDKFTVEILGRGTHGAYPHKGQDTILIAAQFINLLQSVVSREIDPVEPVVISVGSISGGNMFNVLADRVELCGTVRTLNEAVHKNVRKLIERKLSHVTKAYGAKYTFKYDVLGHPLKNDPVILELCRKSAVKVLGAGKVKVLNKPSMGGEDFSEYLRLVPGCFIFFGSACAEPYPWHSEFFDIDERMLSSASAVVSGIALDYLG